MKRNYEIAVVSRGGFARTVRIFGGKNAKYAVIVLDGAALVEQSNKYLFKKFKNSGTALIEIDGTERFDEFLPFKCENAAVAPTDKGGNANALADYVTETLIPYIKKRFSINRVYLLGHSLSAAAALYMTSRANSGISAFGFIDPPLFVAPAAFDDFLKRTQFSKAGYYIACTSTPKLLPEGASLKLYGISAALIAAALANGDATAVTLKTKTDAANLSESVCDFLDFCDEAILYE